MADHIDENIELIALIVDVKNDCIADHVELRND